MPTSRAGSKNGPEWWKMANLQKERDPLLSGESFATLHQEGQKIPPKDTAQCCPQCWAALDILLTPIHPRCHSA